MRPTISFILLFSILSFPLSASDLKRIQDFLTGKQVEYINIYKELNDSKLNFYNEINIWYPQFILPGNKSAEARLNNRMKYIMIEQVGVPAFQKKVKDELERQVNFLGNAKSAQEVEGYEGDEEEDEEVYYRQYEQKNIEPALKDITFEILNYSAPTITMRVRFEYEAKADRGNEESELYYDEIYYLDMVTGKDFRPSDVFRKESIPALSKLIHARVNAQTMNAEDLDDYYHDDDEQPAKKPKVFKGFQPDKEGYACVQLMSVAFIIPSYSKGTEVMDGSGTQVKFTLEEIRSFLNPAGPYSHLRNFKFGNNKGLAKNLNVLTYYRSDMDPSWLDMQPHFFADDMFNGNFQLHAPGKGVSEARFYYWERSGRNDTTQRKKVSRTMKFNEKGLLSRVELFDYGTTPERTYTFTYNSQDKLVKTIEQIPKKKQVHTTLYTYDAQGNLLSLSKLNKEGKQITAYNFAYSDSFFLVEHYSARSSDGGSYQNKRVDLDAKGRPYAWLSIYNGESGYYYCRYDDKNRVIGSFSKKSSPLDGRFVTYINNRLESDEYDGGRYLTRYTYDERGNMVSLDLYDGLRWQSGTQIRYNERNLPIQMKKLVNNNYFEKGDSNRWYIEYEYR